MDSWMFPRTPANAFWVALWLGTLACGVLLVASENDSSKVTDPKEVQALMNFRTALDDPQGSLSSWTKNTDPCTGSWKWVFCDEEKTPQGVDPNFMHVTSLSLLNLNLSGNLDASVGDLRALTILDVMWNSLSGSIPASIGQLQYLRILSLNGNQFSGPLPAELGNLGNLVRLQLDENRFSGPIPSTFSNLSSVMHLHMNNNTLTGTVPSGLGGLVSLLHLLLDTNRLTGTLPSDLASAPNLTIIQLDNNQFSGIPAAYTRIPTLLKLSMRNCSLVGALPNFNRSTSLAVLDLSHNFFTGSLRDLALPAEITSLDLSDNSLRGPVPASVGNLQNLSYLELSNNLLSGEIATNLGLGSSFNDTSGRVILDFQNNSLTLSPSTPLVQPYLQSGRQGPAGPVQVWLNGNPGPCPQFNSNPFCAPNTVDSYLQLDVPTYAAEGTTCPGACSSPEQRRPPPSDSPDACSCAIPIIVYLRLKSPPFAIFDLYEMAFTGTIADELEVSPDQVKINSTEYEVGPRIRLGFFIFPAGSQKSFNQTEVSRISRQFYEFILDGDDATFGPHEIISVSPPASPGGSSGSSNVSTGAIVGIVCGAVLGSAIVSALLLYWCLRRRGSSGRFLGKSRRPTPINVPGVRSFSFAEMVKATGNFRDENLLGKGGYGNVYYGVLGDGQKVAVKRAEGGSLQGPKEFENEIQLLSRVHHRNLVELVGYCNDDGEHINGEQMLVYEFISNGNLYEHLSRGGQPGGRPAMNIMTRIRIALSAARGIQYLHTQADPPIFHRDIKSPNILLDGKYNAKVSDFGLSKLASGNSDFEGVHTGHITTIVKGTPGYLDPEYFLTHKLTDRSDVYSFGVVLLELISGQPPIVNGKNLTREVNAAYREGDASRIVDPRMGSYSMGTVEPLLKLAISCIDSETSRRPSMTDVLHDLEEIWREAPWSEVADKSHMEDDSREVQMGEGEGSGQQRWHSSSSNPSRPSFYNSGESPLISQPNMNILPR